MCKGGIVYLKNNKIYDNSELGVLLRNSELKKTKDKRCSLRKRANSFATVFTKRECAAFLQKLSMRGPKQKKEQAFSQWQEE